MTLANELIRNFSHPSGPAFVRQINSSEVDRISASGYLLSVPLALQQAAFPTGIGQKLSTWAPSGYASSATGIQVVASGQALAFGNAAGTTGNLRFQNGGAGNFMLGARYSNGNSVGLFALLSDDATRTGDDSLAGNYQKVGAAGFQSFQFNNVERWNLTTSNLTGRGVNILGINRFNNRDGQKSYGDLGGTSATGTIAVNPGSGTVFAIPAAATVGQLYAMAPSAIDRDLVLLQNRSVATHAVYNPGMASGLLCYVNPSGAAWTRFNAGSGTWELHGRTQMGF